MFGPARGLCYIYLTKQNTMDKDTKRFWLGRGCTHFIINWNAGLDCWGNKRTKYEYK